MNPRSFRIRPLLFLCAAWLVLGAAASHADEVLRSTGRALSPSQREFVAEKVASLRDADHLRRFGDIIDLIRLGSTAVPFLEDMVRRGSNPIPVRCAILALSEIAPPDAVPLLAEIVKGTKKGRDEKAVALLGLGKRGSLREAVLLRKMLAKGEERLLRRSAALALGRLGDRESLKPLLAFAAREREERAAVTFVLAAALAGGEEYAAKAAGLFKTMKGRRLAALALGSAFEGDPVLEENLLGCAGRDLECDRALAVCLGRYRGEAVESFLKKTATSSKDFAARIDALYSLVSSAGKRAAPFLESVSGLPGKDGTMSAHALLAAAEGGLADPFRDRARSSLSAPFDVVRSAAALALAAFRDRGAVSLLKKALEKEKKLHAALDMILAIGLLGDPQDAGDLAAFAAGTRDSRLASAASTARKVLSGKMERALLEEDFSRRLADISGRWRYRFRDAFMDEVRYGMDLDTIVRRTSGESGSDEESGSSQGGGEEGGGEGEQGGGGTEPPGPPEGPPPDGSPVGRIPGGAGQGGGGNTQPPSGTFPGGSKGRFILHGEVVEWDILGWFDELGYFPDRIFFREP